jgi:hypothetical protein
MLVWNDKTEEMIGCVKFQYPVNRVSFACSMYIAVLPSYISIVNKAGQVVSIDTFGSESGTYAVS